MPFPFAYVCDLLELVEGLVVRDDPLLPATLEKLWNEKTLQWFSNHRHTFNANDTDDRLVLHIFNPEVFHHGRDLGWLDSASLEQIMRRVFSVPNVHLEILQRWRSEPQKGDIGVCLHKVIDAMIITKHRRVSPGKSNELSVERINKDLQKIASYDRESEESDQIIEIFRLLFAPLDSRVAKWLVRLILKDFGPVGIPETFSLSGNHYKLPRCLNVTAVVNPAAALRHGPGLLDFGSSAQPVKASPPLPIARKRRRYSESGRGGVILSPPALRRESTTLKPPTAKPDCTQTEPEKEHAIKPAIIATSLTISRPTSSSLLRNIVRLDDFPPTPPTPAPRVTLGVIPNVPACTMATLDIRTTPEQVSTFPPTPLSSAPLHPASTKTPSQNTAPASTPKALSGTKLIPQFPSHTLQTLGTNIPSSFTPQFLNQGSLARLSKSSKTASLLSRSLVSKCGTGRCRLTTTTTTCPLANCIFLPSPCLASKSQVIDILLAWHGSRYVTSARDFTHSNMPIKCPLTMEKYRKLILVDMFRHEQTSAFLNWVKRVNTKQSYNGKRQVVEVFDWRILEYIGKKDQGKVHEYDVWKRCFVTSLKI